MSRLLAAVCALFLMGTGAFAGTVSPVTGPQDPSQLSAIVNTLIISGNTVWNPGGTGFLTARNISANSTSGVSLTALGPTGLTPTTVVEWLKIRNPSGVYRLIPMWGCPGC